jgi:hypothetical protein
MQWPARWRPRNVARDEPRSFDLFSNSRLAITTNSAGTVFTLRRRASDGNVEAARLDGAALVPIGPVVNDRTPTGDAFGSIAADANGQLFIALGQANIAGTASEVVVKRFDANANAWVTLVAPFPVPAFNGSSAPKLSLNAAGQPVVLRQASPMRRWCCAAFASMAPPGSTWAA